jgi:hypothetical protein
MTTIYLLASLLAFPVTLLAQAKAAPTITLTGQLEGGRVAIGGETSGWMLRYRDEKGPRAIEVEFTASLSKMAKDAAHVRITGTIVDREYVERGRVPTLVATKVEILPRQ